MTRIPWWRIALVDEMEQTPIPMVSVPGRDMAECKLQVLATRLLRSVWYHPEIAHGKRLHGNSVGKVWCVSVEACWRFWLSLDGSIQRNLHHFLRNANELKITTFVIVCSCL